MFCSCILNWAVVLAAVTRAAVISFLQRRVFHQGLRLGRRRNLQAAQSQIEPACLASSDERAADVQGLHTEPAGGALLQENCRQDGQTAGLQGLHSRSSNAARCSSGAAAAPRKQGVLALPAEAACRGVHAVPPGCRRVGGILPRVQLKAQEGAAPSAPAAAAAAAPAGHNHVRCLPPGEAAVRFPPSAGHRVRRDRILQGVRCSSGNKAPGQKAAAGSGVNLRLRKSRRGRQWRHNGSCKQPAGREQAAP